MFRLITRLYRRYHSRNTHFLDYNENSYGREARITNASYRKDLTSWQVPSIKQHLGSLEGKIFIDIGAGDIVLGEKLGEIGRPKKFFVQDLSEPSINAGLKRMNKNGVDTTNIIPLISYNFNFDKVDDASIDFAFSNSLFSHLSLNSIILCLRNLRPKMKVNAKYLTSMIVVPGEIEPLSYDWSYLKTPGSNIISYPTKDPYHYTKSTINETLDGRIGFKIIQVHDYGHPFQKLVEFVAV